ncbi:Outer membrane protein MIP [Legionella parisiensis]|uniref:Outer membrane protein MIP n=1 Tax=Legionella parisiensis TaxID=45071 RepID=A0A1E5JSR7_9GAMM|nr:Outer membrane protein MIP [Legionella parisiensis]
MKMKLVTAAVMGLAMSTVMAATDATSLVTDKDKLSYSIGADLGKTLKIKVLILIRTH